MSNIISVPNLLCLLLAGGLVVHLACREKPGEVVRPAPDRLEDSYCRLPQSHQLNYATLCSSTRRLFLLLSNDCSPVFGNKSGPGQITNQSEGKENSDISKRCTMIDNVKPYNLKVVHLKNRGEEEKEDTPVLVKVFVISLLVSSTVVSLLEWYRDIKRQVS